MKKVEIKIGEKFNLLTVSKIAESQNGRGNRLFVECTCDCGNTCTIEYSFVKNGHTKSCGCLKHVKRSVPDGTIIGMTFGKLFVKSYDCYKNGKHYFICKCECEKEISTSYSNLVQGKTSQCVSCGHKISGTKKAYNLVKIGDRFSRLVVIKKVPSHKTNRTNAYFLCKCDCGNEISVQSRFLRDGRSKSCGCYRRDTLIDTSMIGQKYAMLTIEGIEYIKNHKKYLKCKCDCGNTTIAQWSTIKSGDKKSCGCLNESFGEKKCKEILKKYNITFKKEYVFQDLFNPNNTAHLRFDFAIKSRNGKKILFLLEYDGEQHYHETNYFKQTLSEIQLHDSIKNDYATRHGIPLLRIPYWDFNNIESILFNFINKNFSNLIKSN